MPLPKRVTLELTNRCNRQCQGCPRNKMNYPEGDMSVNFLNDVVNQLPKSTVIVAFFRGESLLHSNFREAMMKLRKFDVVQLATNTDFLTPKKQDTLLKTCSFVSLSLKTFEYPKEGNILQFLRLAQNDGVETQVNVLEGMIPFNEKEAWVSSWLCYADRVRIYMKHSQRGFGDLKESYSTTLIDNLLPCHKPFEEMVVYWDGKVALCNHDWNNGNPLGDLNLESVDQVWNGAKYVGVRQLHESGNRHLVDSCRDCDYWMTSYLPNKMFGELYQA